jgi:hypothetical protein
LRERKSAEVAAELNLSRNAVLLAKSRVLQRLRELLRLGLLLRHHGHHGLHDRQLPPLGLPLLLPLGRLPELEPPLLHRQLREQLHALLPEE